MHTNDPTLQANTDTPAAAGQRQLATEIAALASEAGELLNEFSAQKLQRARQVLAQAESAVGGRAKQVGATAGDYVHAHPWRALGVAAAAGVLLGVLLARR